MCLLLIIIQTVTMWHQDASHQLQDCFHRPKWEVFEYRALENDTTAVLDYIRFCQQGQMHKDLFKPEALDD